jgi:hypothetical protein
VARHPFDSLVVAPGEVPDSGALDLYDPGAEVCELTGGERGGDGLLDRDDGYALKGEGSLHYRKGVS